MQNKAVFLDRDGVINIDKNYVYKIEDFEFISGSVKALKKIKDKGYLIIIITNQSGIGRGYYSKEDYLKLKKHMNNELNKFGIIIDDEYYCKHSPDDKCDCRKPKPKMINDPVKKHNIDVEKSYFIGDKTSDIQAGKNAGLKTILVQTGKGGKDNLYDVEPDFVCQDFYKASEIL